MSLEQFGEERLMASVQKADKLGRGGRERFILDDVKTF